ncbi:sugar phosphate isomerase/epimerase [Microbacterium limosum]|uniref:Sugar phosphate isomerase/epimerase n=1 Tax=Microbacterium limosum TaxID=3079935 RepID=A0AAU0MGV2_9MICO|nr:sugar phosphate isomerase/epimerase [Microbacterium sp. Y20]WOQ69401.1 sugar phosphate isomerase/epimerase [Microbacterium sp. Y20]
MKFAYEANAWGGVVGTPGSVTNLGSGFYETPGDVHGTLEAIAAVGYQGLELFDGNLLPFEDSISDFVAAVNGQGLEVAGVYSGGHLIYRDAHEDELARFDRSIRLAASAGARHYVIGGGAIRSTGRRDEDYRIAGEFLDTVAERARAAGLVASYHPHLGSLAQAPEQIDALFAATSIGLCADVAHIAAGGGDPAAVIRRHADRLAYVHLKDLDATTHAFMPLGEGDLDLGGIIDAVVDAGYDDWITVELDGYEGDQSAAAARSLRFLQAGKLA